MHSLCKDDMALFQYSARQPTTWARRRLQHKDESEIVLVPTVYCKDSLRSNRKGHNLPPQPEMPEKGKRSGRSLLYALLRALCFLQSLTAPIWYCMPIRLLIPRLYLAASICTEMNLGSSLCKRCFVVFFSLDMVSSYFRHLLLLMEDDS